MSSLEESKRRIVIVGGGIAGIATAWGLSQHGGVDVVLLERESQLASHSTAKNASILRTFTGSAASTSLALETADFLARPPAGFSTVPLIDPVGLILIPKRIDTESFAAWRALKQPDSVVEIDEARLHELAPHYRGDARNAVWVRDEGHIDNAALIEGLLHVARAAGVRVRTQAEVSELNLEHGRVCALRLASGERIAADTIVLATGGWAESLARRAGSDLHFEPRRRHLLVTAPEARIDRRWPILWAESESFYVRPESGGLMVCACDQDVVDPDRCDARAEVRELIARRTGECLSGFDDAPVAHFWAGMRTFTADDEFAIGDDPRVPGLFWVAGLGGHGMSTSVGLGRHAARLLLGDSTNEEVHGAFDPSRFSRRNEETKVLESS